ncbi:hypothetical protein HWV62_44907 [Athelia sp. TMB]|nr:hypothetical protein HWV62_44907 [Athelia sp. TMB]
MTDLSHFNTNISPLVNPQQWHYNNMAHIRSLLQETESDGPLEEYLAPRSLLMAYPRLIAYVSTHMMGCSPTEKTFALLDTSACVVSDLMTRTFDVSLQKWTSWDDIEVIGGQQQIREDLEKYFKVLSQAEPSVHASYALQDLLALDVVDLSAQLTILLMDDYRYQAFVACDTNAAQPLLDFLQARLDYPIAPKFKSRHLRALVKLSGRSRRYPECLVLEEVNLPAEPICFGSFGEVYKCDMPGRGIAVKVLKVSKQLTSEDLLKKFAHEAVLWRQLSHPNVLPFYGVFRLGVKQRKLCMVSPWMDNGDLSVFLKDREVPGSLRVLFALDVAKGLVYLHEQNVVHADLKSMNILVSHAPRACLADFGLSTAKGTGSMKSTIRASAGTVRWMGPEFYQDDDSDEAETRRPDQASDVYAFAMIYDIPARIDDVVYLKIFSKRLPFQTKKQEHHIIQAVRKGKRPDRPAVELSPGLTDDVWGIMVDCWAQLPAMRLTADQAAERLRSMPDLPSDNRPREDDRLPTISRKIYQQANHPFAMLESIHVQTDDIQVIAGDEEAIAEDMQDIAENMQAIADDQNRSDVPARNDHELPGIIEEAGHAADDEAIL